MPRFTVEEAAVEARRHPQTVYKALEERRLHGAQTVKGGRWLIRPECLDAWLEGERCPHQGATTPKPTRSQAAAAVTSIRSRSRASA